MKIINIRWTAGLTFCIMLTYLLLLLLFLSLYRSETEPVPPLTSQLKSKLNHSKLKATNNPEILTAKPQFKARKQSFDINPQFLYRGGREDVKFVIGVPTVLRPKKNIVLETVHKLIDRMTPEQRSICLIVIYVGETSLQLGEFIVQELRAKYPKDMMSGLIDVIAPHLHYYPNFLQINTTLMDDTEEVLWRTKRNLDYIYLMSYAQPKGSYYLQLEDDVMVNEGFLDYIEKWLLMQSTFRVDPLHWIAMSFSDMQFFGKLFPSQVLQSFITYLKLFCDHQPIDWLLQSYVTLQTCRWDSISQLDCQQRIDSRIIQVKQSQFTVEKKIQQNKNILLNRDVGLQRLPHLREPLNMVLSHRNCFLKQNFELLPGETFISFYMPHMPKMLKDLISNQYKGTEVRIRNHNKTAKSLPEFSVELVKKDPEWNMKPIPNKRCGFIMSHTNPLKEKAQSDEEYYYENIGDEPDNNYMFYYIKEDSENTLTWFRRFSFGAKDASGRPSFDWILVYMWTLCSFYVA